MQETRTADASSQDCQQASKRNNGYNSRAERINRRGSPLRRCCCHCSIGGMRQRSGVLVCFGRRCFQCSRVCCSVSRIFASGILEITQGMSDCFYNADESIDVVAFDRHGSEIDCRTRRNSADRIHRSFVDFCSDARHEAIGTRAIRGCSRDR